MANQRVVLTETELDETNSQVHHPYAFHVSGPRKVSAPNWRDLINSSWLAFQFNPSLHQFVVLQSGFVSLFLCRNCDVTVIEIRIDSKLKYRMNTIGNLRI